MKHLLIVVLSLFCLLTFAQQKGPQSLAQLNESPAGSKIIDYLTKVNGDSEISDN